MQKKILENNPEPEKNKGISPSSDGEKILHNIPVTLRGSQKLMYLGGIVVAAVIIMIIIFSGISFSPVAHMPLPNLTTRTVSALIPHHYRQFHQFPSHHPPRIQLPHQHLPVHS